jgi:undecaprenyl-diphosphatase
VSGRGDNGIARGGVDSGPPTGAARHRRGDSAEPARNTLRHGRPRLRWLDGLDRLDQAVYRTIANTPTPALDEPLRRLSRAADYSRLSLGAAALLALGGGERGRRAARAGVASLCVTATIVNVAVKPLARRRRPDRAAQPHGDARHVRMPVSRSFPSGHSAAAFAFASGVGQEWPRAAVPLYAVGALLAYSRVHTGVHYPGDVVAGCALGVALAHLTPPLLARLRPGRAG